MKKQPKTLIVALVLALTAGFVLFFVLSPTKITNTSSASNPTDKVSSLAVATEEGVAIEQLAFINIFILTVTAVVLWLPSLIITLLHTKKHKLLNNKYKIILWSTLVILIAELAVTLIFV